MINDLNPKSPKELIDKYNGLREKNEDRDDRYSPLHDGIMNAVAVNLREHCDSDVYYKAYTSSLFPERLAKEVLRLVEQHEERK